jgi:hypothetical protein
LGGAGSQRIAVIGDLTDFIGHLYPLSRVLNVAAGIFRRNVVTFAAVIDHPDREPRGPATGRFSVKDVDLAKTLAIRVTFAVILKHRLIESRYLLSSRRIRIETAVR